MKSVIKNVIRPVVGKSSYAATHSHIGITNGYLYNWYAIGDQLIEDDVLYNWYAVNYNLGGETIAPAGWHVPSYAEYYNLLTYLGGYTIAGKELKSDTDWEEGCNGTNSTGFNAKPTGMRVTTFTDPPLSYFDTFGHYCYLWTSSVNGSYGRGVDLLYNNDELFYTDTFKTSGFSLRLIKNDSDIGDGTVTDYDENIYPTVKIGTQVWMAENLKVEHYNNGTPILNLPYSKAWLADTSGAYSYYNTTMPIAPLGWHVPTLAEWYDFLTEVGESGGGKLKEKGLVHWNTPNTNATNQFGFNGIGSGRRNAGSAAFELIKEIAFYWSSDDNLGSPIAAILEYISEQLGENSSDKRDGFSVRLIKDDSTDTGTMTGNDGKIYNTIKIGSQVWMAQNLAETLYFDGSAISNITSDAVWKTTTYGGRCAYDNDEANIVGPINELK